MATRVFVKCKSHEAPGRADAKIPTMANIVCQKVWGCNFDGQYVDQQLSRSRDRFGTDISQTDWTEFRISTQGAFHCQDQKCYILIDRGNVNADSYTIRQFLWKGGELLESQSSPRLRQYLADHYPFNPDERPRLTSYTDEQYIAEKGIDALNKLKEQRDEIKQRMVLIKDDDDVRPDVSEMSQSSKTID